MSDRERLRAFWQRWDREPDDKVEFQRLKARVFNFASEVWQGTMYYYPEARKKFALLSGTRYSEFTSDARSVDFARSHLSKALESAATVVELVEPIQFLLWSLQVCGKVGRVADCLNEIFDVSPNVPFHVQVQDNVATMYRTGARLLDEAVVESNLAWLEKHPLALKPFEDALKLYLRKDPNEYRHMLDSLRCSLEQMLRSVLGNQKSLENQKEAFLPWLKARGAHSQIVNMYSDLLLRFAQYQNDAVKHGEDKYTPAEVEFVLYLTGTLLRFIQRASEDQQVSAAVS